MSDQQKYNQNPDGDNRIQRWTVALFSVLVVLSFALSYDALHQIAMLNGKPDWRSWLWPLLIDGALIIFSLYIVYSVRRGLGQTRRYWTLVGVFTVLTIAFNVLSSVQHIALRVVVAAIPPVVLFASFETLMSMIRDSVRQPDNRLTVPPVQPDTKLTKPTVQPDSVKPAAVQSDQPVIVQPAQSAQSQLTDRQRLIVGYVQDNPDASIAAIARSVDVHRNTVSGDIKQLQDSGILHKNGSGWKVRY